MAMSDLSEIPLCCFCDNLADDRPGAPLCSECWGRCERKARDSGVKIFPILESPLDREAQRLALDPNARHLAGFVGVAAIGGPPKGTTLQ
jgi:hypothetical protein